MATAAAGTSGKVQVKSFVDEDLRRQATELFENIGMSMSTAINVFLRQSVAEGRLPFKPGYPDAPQIDWSTSRAVRARMDDSGAVVVPASWRDDDDD